MRIKEFQSLIGISQILIGITHRAKRNAHRVSIPNRDFTNFDLYVTYQRDNLSVVSIPNRDFTNFDLNQVNQQSQMDRFNP